MPSASTTTATRALGLALGVVLAIAGAAWILPGLIEALQPARRLVEAMRWVQEAGPLGDVVFVLLYGVQTVLLVPASWAHASAGFLYGPWVGWLVASTCATAFSTLNFWLGRTLLRGPVARRVAASPRLSALDRAIGDRGAWMVFLLRLPPISPFNPLSYALGATRVRFGDFLLGTWLGGMLPIAVFSQIGAGLSDLAAFFAGEATGPGWLQAVGLGVTVVVSAVVARYAKRALDPVQGGAPPAQLDRQ